MKEQLAKIRAEALSAFEGAQSALDLDAIRVKYLGKKGELTAVLKLPWRTAPSGWKPPPWSSACAPRRWMSPSPASGWRSDASTP